MDVEELDVKISKELIPYICTIKDGRTVSDKTNIFRRQSKENFVQIRQNMIEKLRK